jgi:hypothetical protein
VAHTPIPDDADLPEPADDGEQTNSSYVHGRDLVPMRRQPTRNYRIRQLLGQEDQLRDEIRQLDQQMLDLAARRQTLLDRAKRLHHEIRPTYASCRGRRRRNVTDEAPLPPVAANPTHVMGRELRALCLTFLQQAGRALALRELHAQIHRAGYAIFHPHPVKALADALGHEADAQRCRRVRRGVYSLNSRPPSLGTDFRVALPDW